MDAAAAQQQSSKDATALRGIAYWSIAAAYATVLMGTDTWLLITAEATHPLELWSQVYLVISMSLSLPFFMTD